MLVCDPTRFREDLILLNERTRIDFVAFPNFLHDKLVTLANYLKAKNQKTEKKVNELIVSLLKKTHCSGFITCSMFYLRNITLEKICKDEKISFYCLYREGVGETISGLQKSFSLKVAQTKRKNFLTHIFFPTDSVKKIFRMRGLLKKNQVIKTTGLPRFDFYINQKSENSLKKSDPVTVVFSFFPTQNLREVQVTGEFYGSGYLKLFESVHGVAALLAEKFGRTIIIKPKWYAGKMKNLIDSAIFNYTGKKPYQIKKLKISDKISATDAINNSHKVVSFNSTTLVESLLAKKITIFPIYEEALGNYKDYVFYPKHREFFHVVSSEHQLTDTILSNRIKPKKINSVCKKFLGETIGPLDGKNCKRVEKYILEDQKEHNQSK